MTELPNPVTLEQLQAYIRKMYGAKDERRGTQGTFLWLLEEVGELAAAVRHGDPDQLAEEFADVLAWLATLANTAGVDLTSALADKYGTGCPGCDENPCVCSDAGKP